MHESPPPLWSWIVVTLLAVPGLYGILHIQQARYDATVAPLRSADDRVREEAVKTLRGGGPETVYVLTKALKDEDLRVRVGAARALGEFREKALAGGVSPIPALLEAIENSDPDTREAAALALEKIEPHAPRSN